MTITWAILALFFAHQLPFVSMQGYDEWRVNDCGPAAAAAVINGYTNANVKAYQFFDEFGVGDKPQRPGYIFEWLIRRGVPSDFKAEPDPLTLDNLQRLLLDRPVIVGLPGHWEVAVGHADGAYLVYDPWAKNQRLTLISDGDMALLWRGVAIWPKEGLWPVAIPSLPHGPYTGR